MNRFISVDLDKKKSNCKTPNKGSTKSVQTDDPKQSIQLPIKGIEKKKYLGIQVFLKTDVIFFFFGNCLFKEAEYPIPKGIYTIEILHLGCDLSEVHLSKVCNKHKAVLI